MAPLTRRHTPGPWSLDVTRAIFGKDFTGQWKAIVDRVRGGSPTQADANARLIVAAPELLEELIRLTNESSGFLSMAAASTHGYTNIAVLRERISNAQDAIVKATWGA